MKKRYSTLVMAALCLFLSKIKAQSQPNQNVRIGQKIPEVTLTNIHNYRTSKLNLADFDKKLIIIDFWATWCSPCISMIPKMDSLQKEFTHDLQIITVSYQDKNEVLPFMDKMEKQKGIHYQIPIVTNDQLLAKLFPHRTLPHYVWIGGDGTVKAITGAEEITSANIEKMLNGFPVKLGTKKDIRVAYNNKKPFLIDNNGGSASTMFFHSIMTNFQEGMNAGYTNTAMPGFGRISAYNEPLLKLFTLSYLDKGIAQKRVICTAPELASPKDGIPQAEFHDWLTKKTFCYELLVPPAQASAMYGFMRQDLERLFPDYQAGIGKKKMKCLVLERTSSLEKFKSKGGEPLASYDLFSCKLRNTFFISFITRMDMIYLQKNPIPLIDNTGYENAIDLELNCKLSDLNEVNQALKAYDLALVEKELDIDVLLIERKPNQQSQK